MSRGIRWVAYGLMSFAVGIGAVGCGEDMPIEEEFAGSWDRSFDIEITRALSENGARDCGEYVHKESRESDGYHLVYCTADGKSWIAYKVWLPLGEVEGPFYIHADIPPPK